MGYSSWLFTTVLSVSSLGFAKSTPSSQSLSIVLENSHSVVVNNSAILAGSTNSTASPVTASSSGDIVTYSWLTPCVVKVNVNTDTNYVGARFSASADDLFYGVWEYPWFDQITNTNVEFDLKGVGNSDGVNWSNARAPFFMTSAGYGVYADTLEMGSFDFSTPGEAQFIFNSSSITYYIILPESPGNFKSIIREYTAISSRIEMPPDSGYGPTFWSDDFEEDFHGTVSNAQENYYDVVNHLYYNEIRATSMFADRKFNKDISVNKY
jgi:alpha-D-xyloside xylohydrolase